MPDIIGEAFVAIRPDGSKFAPELKTNIDKALTGVGGQLDEFGRKATKLGKTLSLALTVPIAGLATVGFRELSEAGKVAAQTEAAIRSTGAAANVSAGQIEHLGTALLAKTGIDDEAIKSGANLLLTFTNVRNEAGKGNDIFNQATKAALNLSVAFGKDVSSSAILVGKALQDPIKGVTALRRVGVQLSADQEIQIKRFVELGDVMGAQKIILGELTTEVGGSAKAYGETMAGQVSKAKEELKNAAAVMISTAAPAIKAVSGAALSLAHYLEGLGSGARTAAGAFLVFLAALGPVSFLLGKLAQLASGTIDVILKLASGVGFLAGKAELAVAALRAMTLAEIGAAAGATLGIAAVAALTLAFFKSAGAYERTTAAAKKWAETTIISAKSSGDELKALTATQAQLSKEIDKTQAALEDLNRGQVGSGMTTQEIANKNRELGATLLALQKRHGELTPEIQRLKAAHKEAQAAEKARQAAIKELADGTKDFTTATDEAKQAVLDLQSAVLAASGGDLAVEQAKLSLTRAEENLTKVREDSTSTAEDIRGAELDLEQARISLAGATLSAQDAQQKYLDSLSGPDAVNAARAEVARLEAAQAKYGDAGGELQKLIDKLNTYIASLGKIPPTVTTALQLQLAVSRDFANLFDPFNEMTPDQIEAATRAAQGRASGGPVGPGSWLVGERGNGAELLTLNPGSSGTVTSAAETAQMVGGDNYTITVATPSPDPVAMAVQMVKHHRAAQYLVGV